MTIQQEFNRLLQKYIVLPTAILFLLLSCKSAKDAAQDSLVGTWSVKEIYQYNPSTGNFAEDKSAEGVFQFTDSTCTYSYIFDSKSEKNSFEYEFQVSKVNSGFTKVKKFDILGDKNYIVRFGDQTFDAHIEATHIALEETVSNDSMTYNLLIQLEKS